MSPAPSAETVESSRGILFIVSAPSGAGKTSLVSELPELESNMLVAVSHTTREKRPMETDAVNYHFVAPGVFQQMIKADAFLEYAKVFDHLYGTSKAAVERDLRAGRDVLLEIDWQGARQVRAALPQAVSIFILPPSLASLRSRLRSRGQDDDAVIQTRLATARSEISHCDEYDYLVVNDDFSVALGELRAITHAEHARYDHRRGHLKTLLDELLSTQ